MADVLTRNNVTLAERAEGQPTGGPDLSAPEETIEAIRSFLGRA